jgi:hypothetical protein
VHAGGWRAHANLATLEEEEEEDRRRRLTIDGKKDPA